MSHKPSTIICAKAPGPPSRRPPGRLMVTWGKGGRISVSNRLAINRDDNVREVGWRMAVQEQRASLPASWAAASPSERRRFLRHLRPWWDVHRHRAAPEAAAWIDRLIADGRLRFAAGRIRSATRANKRVQIGWQPRGKTEIERIEVDRIVNCTGPDCDLARSSGPLLASLLAAGRIRTDGCRLGIDADANGQAIGGDGRPSGLIALGPLTRGAFWEITAVAEIAAQAKGIAMRLARPQMG